MFEEVKPQETAHEADASLESNYQLQLGVRMRQSLQELPKPDLKLVETKAVEKWQANFKSSISNIRPVAFGNISVNTTIRDKNQAIVGGFKSENFQFAQNSVLDLYSEFEQEELKPGTYTIRIELSSQRGTWVLMIRSLSIVKQQKLSTELRCMQRLSLKEIFCSIY